MIKVCKILNFIVLGMLILICCLGTFYEHISFGLGLGDIFGYFVLYIGTIIHSVLTLIFKKKGAIIHIVLAITFFIFTILIALNATIWRGNEYRWNGSIFYLPCPTEIKIKNEAIEKKLLIQMCTGEYYSEFIGTWDGKQLIFKQGEVRIPKKLEKYIKRPITKVEIEPQTDYVYIYEDDKLIEKLCFNNDNLKVNKDYFFYGEIIEIKNYQPVIKGTIKIQNTTPTNHNPQ